MIEAVVWCRYKGRPGYRSTNLTLGRLHRVLKSPLGVPVRFRDPRNFSIVLRALKSVKTQDMAPKSYKDSEIPKPSRPIQTGPTGYIYSSLPSTPQALIHTHNHVFAFTMWPSYAATERLWHGIIWTALRSGSKNLRSTSTSCRFACNRGVGKSNESLPSEGSNHCCGLQQEESTLQVSRFQLMRNTRFNLYVPDQGYWLGFRECDESLPVQPMWPTLVRFFII